MLKIGTFNILNTSCRYSEREPLIKEAIQSMNCDVLGVQEVNEKNLETLSCAGYKIKLGRLPVPMTKSVEPCFRIDGNAIIYREDFEEIEYRELVYAKADRMAQLLVLSDKGKQFVVVNTHLDHLDEDKRKSESIELLKWVEEYFDKPVFITGDFNFQPWYPCYPLYSENFTSTYCAVHGREPILTFPTGLMGPNADPDRWGCYDYVWFRNAKALEAGTVTLHSNINLFPSDHFPVWGQLSY